jgi:hypothetical protein
MKPASGIKKGVIKITATDKVGIALLFPEIDNGLFPCFHLFIFFRV